MDIEELKAKLPLEEMLEGKLGIQFSKRTARYNWALCPFHEETDPSFVVDKFSHTAHCWSSTCLAHKHMDHVKFLQLYEHLSRELAIDRLYQLVGQDRPINTLHDVLQKVLERLVPMNMHQLAGDFFRNRGISQEALNEFRVGYSPSYNWFKNQIGDISQDAAAKLEFFRIVMFDNAIVYPLFDGLGRMAGFRSRPLGGSFAKYIANQPDFPLKPSRVYGMHLIRNRQIVLVEGPNDALGFWSVGVRNTGALMGTNLKDIDNQLTQRGFSDIVFISDGDEAGKEAMFKAPDLVRVNTIPKLNDRNTDPDEFARDKGILAIVKLIEEAKYPPDIKLDARLARIPDTLSGKITLIKSIASDISDGLHPIIVRKMQDKIAKALEIPPDDVYSIFDMAEFDSSDLESKMLWHIFSQGPLSEDIKSKVEADSIADPRMRKQYQEMLNGFSPSESILRADGLTEGDVGRFLDLAKRRHLKRLLRTSSYSVSNLNEGVDDVLNRMMNQMSKHAIGDIEVLNMRQQLDVGIHNAIERSNNPGLLGLSLGKGFKNTDEILQGLRPQSVYVLAASQGTGKSALTLQWAVDMAVDLNVPVLWISLEMSPLDMSIRILSKLTRIPAIKVMRGNLTPEEKTILASQSVKYMNSPLYIASVGGMSIQQIVSLTRKYKMLHGIRAVFIDYIQLIESGTRDQTMYERVGRISRMIKSSITMDKSISIPVVAVAQLSRTAKRHDVPTAEDVAESYKIAQDADVFMTIRRLSKDEIEANKLENRPLGNMILNIDKNRSGVDKMIIGLQFDLENMTISEVLTQMPHQKI